jgi:ABC-type lipoprotein release transport system permease subunit
MKHKNNDLVPQIFLAVVGVILVGIIIYYVMNSVQNTTKLADTILLNTESTISNYTEYDIVKYDCEEIRGSEVTNFIRKNLGDYDVTETAPIYVEVITMLSGLPISNTYRNKEHIENVKNFSSIQYYIKPTAIFEGEVLRNANKVILGIKFTQK